MKHLHTFIDLTLIMVTLGLLLLHYVYGVDVSEYAITAAVVALLNNRVTRVIQ